MNENGSEKIRLTQYSRGAGCGCKIAPAVLTEILKTAHTAIPDKQLLVGNSSKDDAAVYDIGNGQALISTTDFFMPIVDDAKTFGAIAAANSISDVYAMGGKPILAIAILGWPVEQLPATLAQQVLDGAREICTQAGISLAGGHSIDSTEPIFGLAVTGMVTLEHLCRNDTACAGDYIFCTKPIGSGILATALKRGLISEAHQSILETQLTELNSLGEALGKISAVSAMTDVTGFGLLGHLIEMAEGASLSAELYYNAIRVTEGAQHYLTQRAIPDATYRNWNSYSKQVGFEKGVNVMEAFNLLPDPQTNGGLLFSVNPEGLADVTKLLEKSGLGVYATPIGRFTELSDKTVFVKNGLS